MRLGKSFGRMGQWRDSSRHVMARNAGALALLLMTLAAAVSGCSPARNGTTDLTPAMATDSSSGSAPKSVKFKTGDGWTIVGKLYVPAGTSKGVVILLHQRGGAAKDWETLCGALQRAGIIALAIDQRGAGFSTVGPGPTGSDAPWETSGDIAAAIERLKGKGPVGLAGASYGANNALIYAAAHPQQVRGVALFSPGADYHGLDALTPARSYRGHLAIYHYKNDSVADSGPEQINDASPSRDHTLHLYEGDGHGADLLTTDALKDSVNFFVRVFQNTRS